MAELIPVSTLNLLCDDMALIYRKVLGTSGSGLGAGNVLDADPGFGAQAVARQMKADTIGAALLTPIGALAQSVIGLNAACDGLAIARNLLTQTMSALGQHTQTSGFTGVSNLADFIDYYNVGVGGTWTALQSPHFKTIFDAIGGAVCLAKTSTYFEVLQGGSFEGTTFTNALAKGLITGAGAVTVTPGFITLDTSKYCGGFGWVVASGITGSGLVTVTGDAFDPVTKAVVTGVTFTATVSGNGSVQLAVGTAPANSLLTKVTALSVAAGLTAGTLYIECRRPAGRTQIV